MGLGKILMVRVGGQECPPPHRIYFTVTVSNWAPLTT